MNMPYKVLLLADSRGFAVDRFISRLLRNREDVILIEAHSYSGAKIEEVVTRGRREAQYRSYDQVYLLAGVNDLTIHKGRRRIKPKFYSWSLLVRQLMIDFHVARTRLQSLSAHIIVCDLVGLHIGSYNYSRDGESYGLQQSILDAAIIRINEYVHEMNYNAWVFSPRFADIVHKSRFPDRPIHHRYDRTTKDGLHYTAHTTEKFAILLLINILNLRRDIAAYPSTSA